jgi:hypothetical protein
MLFSLGRIKPASRTVGRWMTALWLRHTKRIAIGFLKAIGFRKYIAADSKLRRVGLRRSSVMSSGKHPEFSLP